MNKVNTGFGKEEKKVNPLKVLGIIALIIIAVGIIIFAKDYDRNYHTYIAPETVEETTDNASENKDGENQENNSEENSENNQQNG